MVDATFAHVHLDSDSLAAAGLNPDGQTLYISYSDPTTASDDTTGVLQGTDGSDVAGFGTSFFYTQSNTTSDNPVFNSASYDDASKRITLEFTGMISQALIPLK